MPTPEIDNTPEQIDVPDQLPTADQVPDTLTPDQSSETLTSGTDNPQPQIERNTDNLVAILNRLQNLVVTQFFEPNTTDSTELAEQRQYFKDGLTIDVEADSAVIADIKCRAMDRFIGLDTTDLAKVYGVPIEEFGVKVRYKPQVCLKFREVEINPDDLPLRDDKLVKEISFRILGDNIPNSYQDLSDLRDKILNAFSGYSWLVSNQKTYTYRDTAKGYRLAIDVEKDVFTEIVTKVLSIQGDTYDESFVGSYDVSRPLTPPTATVLGRTVNLPFRGRWGTVYFWRAEYKQDGIADKIIATNVPLEP